jgi:hypothetical protein
MEMLSNQPAKFEWRVYRNDTTVITIVVADDDNLPVDLSGWTISGKVRQLPTSSTSIADLTITEEYGVLTVSLDTTDLERINYFDIQAIQDSTSKVRTLVSGVIYVEEDVTR